MITTDTAVNPTQSATTQPYTNRPVRRGQVWKDGHIRRPDRLLLVLHKGINGVVCQDVKTGHIGFIQLKQFNRASSGYDYACEFSDFAQKNGNVILQGLIKCFGDQITKISQLPNSITNNANN
jgi:hypothetical protein